MVVVALVTFLHSFQRISQAEGRAVVGSKLIRQKEEFACQTMRKGQRASSSSDDGEKQRSWSKDGDSKDGCSLRGSSSDEDTAADSDVEAECVMKRSQRFSRSFSFGEEQQPQSKNKDRANGHSPKDSNGVPVAELEESELVAEGVHLDKQDSFCGTSQPPRPSLFRPQELWLSMMRCLSLRWPPCLSLNKQSDRKVAYQVDLDQSEDTQSSDSSISTNGNSTSTSTSDKRDVALVESKEEEVRARVDNNGPAPARVISRSSPRLPRVRQASDSVLASASLEKEMFLRIELVDMGEESGDLCYRADWRLSERTKELAQGVWLSRSQKLMD